MRRQDQRSKRDERSASRGAAPELGLVGWVLAGGSARGAYEVGVCDYIFEHVAPELAAPLPLDVVSGTSVGAIHGCAIASRVDDPRGATTALIERWTTLRIDDVIRVDRRRAFNMILGPAIRLEDVPGGVRVWSADAKRVPAAMAEMRCRSSFANPGADSLPRNPSRAEIQDDQARGSRRRGACRRKPGCSTASRSGTGPRAGCA